MYHSTRFHARHSADDHSARRTLVGGALAAALPVAAVAALAAPALAAGAALALAGALVTRAFLARGRADPDDRDPPTERATEPTPAHDRGVPADD